MDMDQSEPPVPCVALPDAPRPETKSWTVERVNKLIAFVSLGPACPSMRDIALDLFGTEKARSAVAGKMHRMGMCNRLSKEQRNARRGAHNRGTTPGMRPPRGRKPMNPADRATALAKGPRPKEKFVPQELLPPDIQFMCSLLELGPLSSQEPEKVQCRAPFGDPGTAGFSYCGAPGATMPGPYCAFHNRLFYQTGTARRPSRNFNLNTSPAIPDYSDGPLLGEFPMVQDGDSD